MTDEGIRPTGNGRKRKYDSIIENLKARKDQDRIRAASKINIGKNITEWTKIKVELGLKTNAAVAALLIER